MMNKSIGKKIWNYTISVGQIVTTFLIFNDRPVNDKKLALS